MCIPCPRNQHAYWISRNSELASRTFPEPSFRDVGRISCLEQRHRTFSPTFPGRNLLDGVLEDSSRWSIVPKHPGSNGKCSPKLTLLSHFWLSRISRDLLFWLTQALWFNSIGTLCYRREAWVHDSPTVSNLGNYGTRFNCWCLCVSLFFLHGNFRVLAIRYCVAWTSTLITHKHSRPKK